MTNVAYVARRAIYDLYDRYHEALRSSDAGSLLNLYEPTGRYILRGPNGEVNSSAPGPLIDHLLAKIRRVPGAIETGLDVYAVGIRQSGAVALVEEWIDDMESGRRETRLSLETLRLTDENTWRITESTSEETSSSLG